MAMCGLFSCFRQVKEMKGLEVISGVDLAFGSGLAQYEVQGNINASEGRLHSAKKNKPK